LNRIRGLVVDHSGDKVTVMTKDGRLMTFTDRNADVLVGEEILAPSPGSANVFSAFLSRKVIAALALSVILVVVSFFGYTQYLEARPSVAYVTLDLPNSPGSVELEVNDKGVVKAATGFDAAGQDILSAIPCRLKPVEKVVEAFVKATTTKDASGLIIGIVPIKDNPNIDTLEKKIAQQARKSLKAMRKSHGLQENPASDQAASVQTLILDLETREAAKQLEVSAARAALWALAKNTARKQPGQNDDTGTNAPASTDVTSVQEKKIKSEVPDINPNEVLKAHSPEKRAQYLKELTKNWVKQISERKKEGKEEHTKNEGKKDKGKDTKQPPKKGDAGRKSK